MLSTASIINIFVFCCLAVSLAKDGKKTVAAFKVAGKAFLKIIPMVLIIILFIGLMLGFIPEEAIARYLGANAGFVGTLIVALLGAVMYMPALVAFPLAGSLMGSGAAVASVAAFIATLTMVGTVTLPLEIKELGKRMALLRNGLSFGVALLIAVLMGLILR